MSLGKQRVVVTEETEKTGRGLQSWGKVGAGKGGVVQSGRVVTGQEARDSTLGGGLQIKMSVWSWDLGGAQEHSMGPQGVPPVPSQSNLRASQLGPSSPPTVEDNPSPLPSSLSIGPLQMVALLRSAHRGACCW